jgi:hypothetical protein
MRPSEITGSASAHKPLIQLTEADLRAAGVTFHTGEDVAGKSAEAWIEGMGKSVRVPRGRIDEIEESGQDDTEGADEDEDGEDAEDADDEDSDDGRDSAMEAFWDEFFDALMWTVPFSFLYLMLDV